MKLRMIFAAFLIGMLLFGCIGGQGGEDKSKTSNVSNESSVTPAGNATTPSTDTTGQAATGPSNETEPQGSSSTDLTGKTWDELVLLESPVECEVTYKDPAVAQQFEKVMVYLKGKKFKQVVTVSMDGVPMTITTISPDDGFGYMSYSDPSFMQSMTQGKIECDGMKVGLNESTTSSASQPQVDVSDFKDPSKVDLNCKPGAFGDEIFQVTGKYCTTEEIMSALTGGMGPSLE